MEMRVVGLVVIAVLWVLVARAVKREWVKSGGQLPALVLGAWILSLVIFRKKSRVLEK